MKMVWYYIKCEEANNNLKNKKNFLKKVVDNEKIVWYSVNVNKNNKKERGILYEYQSINKFC